MKVIDSQHLLSGYMLHSSILLSACSIMQDTDLEEFWETARNQAYLKEKIASVNQENCELKKQVQVLEQRLIGARYATKYMDKEISGRYMSA